MSNVLYPSGRMESLFLLSSITKGEFERKCNVLSVQKCYL